jgi:hypothetical protein
MKISESKKEKISEQILGLLYVSAPKPLFTSHIAQEIIRDEEFVKKLLIKLKNKKLIVEIKKNSKGIPYSRRSRWQLSNSAYNFYNSYK